MGNFLIPLFYAKISHCVKIAVNNNMKSKKQKVATGMVDGPKVLTLQEILVKNKIQRLQFSSVEDYSFKLRRMTDADLYDHSSELGITPGRDREVIISNLVKKFVSYKGEGVANTSPAKPVSSQRYEDFLLNYKR